MEQWKSISEMYEISSHGRIRNSKTNKILCTDFASGRYEYIKITLHGKRQNYLIHRLVATAFLEKPEGKNMVNHKDGNKTNNNVDNLEWCTQKENTHHSRFVIKTSLMITSKQINALFEKHKDLSTEEFYKILLENCR